MFKFCYLCGKNNFNIKNQKTRDNPNIKVIQCCYCSLTTLNSHAHLNKISYEHGNMHKTKINSKEDYQKLLNDCYNDDYRRSIKFKNLILDKEILDFGCGAGGFLKLVNNKAKNIYGVEIDNITKFYDKEIKIKKNIKDFQKKFDIITLFHVLEHIPEPINFLIDLKKYIKPNGIIIIEVPNDNDALISYYKLKPFKNFTYWSLHLYSYNKKTLNIICQKANFNKITINNYQRYSFANHIGWLKDGKPGGQTIYKEFNNLDLNQTYIKRLKDLNICDTLIAKLNI